MKRAVVAAGAIVPLAFGARSLLRRKPRSAVPYHLGRPRILILGGGFGGFSVAKRLARTLPTRAAVMVVDRNDHFTFWPMLPDVISGAIELGHTLRPLDADLAALGVDFMKANVEAVDLEARTVETSSGRLAYDALVIALGWETNLFGVDGAREHSLQLNGALDAVRIRDRVLDRFLQASAEEEEGKAGDPATLTFAVVGGGSTGVEVAANLRELTDAVAARYPAVDPGQVRVALLEAGDEPLPHLDPKLRRIADARVEAERIEVRRNAKVVSVDEHGVGLSDGSRVEAATVVWAAGVKPNPLAGRIRGAETDEKGRLEVDPCLRVNGHDLVFALGDIAAASSGGRGVPPTAQAAVQEGAAVADNLVAELAGKTTAAFAYKQLGRFVDLGSRFAVSEVMGARISGRVAKLLWRAVYLYKLGDRRDRAAVLSDWILTRAGLRSVTRLPV